MPINDDFRVQIVLHGAGGMLSGYNEQAGVDAR